MQDNFTSKSTHSSEAPKKSAAGKVILALILIGAAAGGGYYYWRTTQTQTGAAGAPAAADGAAGGGGRGGRRGGGGGAVPVVTAMVKEQDLPVYLDGIGTVTAFNTVTVKSRVDGELVEVDFKEGQDVKKGDQLAVIDPRPYQVQLAQAKALLAKDSAQLKDAMLNADRYDELVKEGVIPKQQADTQRALANQLQGSVQGDQAQIDNAQLNVTYSRIIAPVDGRIGLRLVDPGNIVHASDQMGMLVITQMQPISVIFTLPEDNLPAVNNRIRAGGNMQVQALTRDNGTQLASGTLLTIDNQIDQTTGTFKLKAVFNNQDRALWPNQFVNARLLLDTQKNAVVVPAAAIQRGTQGTFAYRVKSDRTVEIAPITLGISQGNVTAIANGLAAGDQVVTDGQDRLRAGMQVVPNLEGRPVQNAGDAGAGDNAGGGGRRRGGRGGNQAAQGGDQNGAGNASAAAADPPAGGQQGQGQGRRNGFRNGGNGGQAGGDAQGGQGGQGGGRRGGRRRGQQGQGDAGGQAQ